jgi:Family of unknown function (DUF5996)
MATLSEPQSSASAVVWPELRLASWRETIDTLHMWTQIVGKVRLALEPMLNHWWQVTLYVSSHGLTTSLMPAGDFGLEIEFDFLYHVLEVRTTRGDARNVALEPKPVATFYAQTMAALEDLGLRVPILARPVEISDAIPFAEDDLHRAYDPHAAHSVWRALVAADRVLSRFRAQFIGKASPVHFFWGGFDLAVTRFSGRPAPTHPGGIPNCADWVMREAYSHEVSSCGYWPGGDDEGSFYSYAYPEPAGFAGWKAEPEDAHYDSAAGEFLLPYSVVRRAADPEATLMRFLQSTYEAAAELGHWDRAALERRPAP